MLLFSVLIVVGSPLTGADQQPGSPSSFVERRDLTPSLPADMGPPLRILRFIHSTDVHIIDDDAPYPLRQENLDRLGDPFTAAQRPQEEYTDEAFNSILPAFNELSDRDPIDYVIFTGDNIDNTLENELVRFIDVIEGRYTEKGPVTKSTYKPDGQSRNPDDTSNDVTDAATSLPAVFKQPGYATPLNRSIPWYVVFGNHDGLIQGNAPIEPSFREVAARYGRYFIDQQEYISLFFDDPQLWGNLEKLRKFCQVGLNESDPQDGHGFAGAGARLCDANPDNDGYYTFEAGGFHHIVLDTMNDDFVQSNGNFGPYYPASNPAGAYAGGYAEGVIDPAQLQWLIKDLEQNKTRPIIVYAHHTVNSFVVPQGQSKQAGYVSGEELTAELNKYPNVAFYIGGHTHKHRIQAKKTFWNVETASLIDPPHENRLIEIYVAPNGTGYLEASRIPIRFNETYRLSATDPQEQGDREKRKGTALDRDVRLWFQLPQPAFETLRAELDRNLEGIFEADQVEIRVGEPVTFRFNVTTRFTRQAPPDSTEFGGFVQGDGFFERVPVEAAGGAGTLTYNFTVPGTFLVGVNVTGPDVVERWVGSTFAVLETASPAPEREGGAPVPLAVTFFGLVAAVLLWRRR